MLSALAEHLTNAEIAARLYISIRTVESHVSSLLRKLQVEDRRALAAAGARLGVGGPGLDASMVGAARPVVPAALTSFVGRRAERELLADALGTHRLVTAVGPGGVGKTRLALSVLADVADRFGDGAWYVDLVPVSDSSMIASAIAAALGLGERQGRSAEQTVAAWLADRDALLVLDNCEHLLDGVVVSLERLLAGSSRLVVLATSRARLLVPFEWVFPVPSLSLESRGDGPGEAVELFLTRAVAGGRPLATSDWPRVAALCRDLDGMPLAIELAAARYASLGLDGLEAGLADRLRLLTGGARIDDRHRSLRSTLDWSYALLDTPARAVLRRVSVFAAPFTAVAAGEVAGWPPVDAAEVAPILADLVDQSLLLAVGDEDGTRYRAAETIRQYGDDRSTEADESARTRTLHMRWCLDAARQIVPDAAGWRAAFDAVADDLRSALGWAAGRAERHADAYQLATRLADLCFQRGLPGEAQRRFEQAAGLATSDRAVADALRHAAGAAESRHFGHEALELYRAAASAARLAGDRAGAASDLARAAELITRRPGLMAWPAPIDELDGLLAEARVLAAGDPAAEALVFTAEVFAGDNLDPVNVELADRAVELARRAGEPLVECAALDELTSIQLAQGEVGAAVATAAARADLAAGLAVTPISGMEISDALVMAAECAVAAGDLGAGRRYGQQIADLPFHREEGHLATARLIVVATLAGDWDEGVRLAERFREGWERAGGPRAGNLSRGAYAAATLYGLRGEADERTVWLHIVDALTTPGRPVSDIHVGEFFDALLALHQGRPEDAMELLRPVPEQFRAWYNNMWRPWYAAVWTEAAVLTGQADAADRIHRARLLTRDNPIAAAMVERAAALSARSGSRDALSAAAAALDAAGCRYQWARTLVLIGGAERTRGQAALAEMGATPMAVPTGRR